MKNEMKYYMTVDNKRTIWGVGESKREAYNQAKAEFSLFREITLPKPTIYRQQPLPKGRGL